MTNATRLNKVQVRIIARDALREGRVADALLILTDRYDGRTHYSLDAALVEMACEPTAKVGDILYTSWGYDQTNVDFYEVTRVKGKTVYVRAIAKNYHPSMSRTGADYVSAARGAFVANETRHTIRKHYSGVGYTLSISCFATAWLWDGEPKFETASGYGH